MNSSTITVFEKHWPESSNVARTKFNSEKSQLEVEFKNGKTYQYKGFPIEKWSELIACSSIGKFIASNVVKNYPGTQI